MTTEELQQRCAQIVRKHLPDARWQLWVFGSQVRGDVLPSSDLDLAVLGPGPVPKTIWVRIKEEIDDLPTVRTVDLVDLGEASEAFRRMVMSEGRRLEVQGEAA